MLKNCYKSKQGLLTTTSIHHLRYIIACELINACINIIVGNLILILN